MFNNVFICISSVTHFICSTITVNVKLDGELPGYTHVKELIYMYYLCVYSYVIIIYDIRSVRNKCTYTNCVQQLSISLWLWTFSIMLLNYLVYYSVVFKIAFCTRNTWIKRFWKLKGSNKQSKQITNVNSSIFCIFVRWNALRLKTILFLVIHYSTMFLSSYFNYFIDT